MIHSPSNRILFLVAACVFVLIFVSCSPSENKRSFKMGPIVFDAGHSGSKIRSGAILLDEKSLFTPEKMYGWTEAPKNSFNRADLKRSRSHFLLDGLSAQKLGFRADLTSGKWWLTCWIEAGKEDSSTLQLYINQEAIPLNWHPFRKPSEPRNSIQDMYRVFHVPFHVNDAPFEFVLDGNEDVVRLLGFSVIPDPSAQIKVHQNLMNKISMAGSYKSSENLEEVMNLLKQELKKDPDDPFSFYWLEQLQLLSQAEILLNYMGWEWASRKTGLSIFDRYHQAVMILDGLLNRPDVDSYPLYERSLWTRAKLLYWLGKERGGKHETAKAQQDFQKLLKRYPEEKVLAMYTGIKLENQSDCSSMTDVEGAPEWSIIQREAMCRMREIAHWWVNERQTENGEFGGKLGDDVEILRWWPSLILYGDATAFTGWKKLADCVWSSPQVYKGYSESSSDVEHASEYISDTAPMMVLYCDDPVYEKRLTFSARYFKSLWTGYSDHGSRLFRSAWFGSQNVETDPPKNRDLEYNTRAMKAVRYLLWKTEDPELKKYVLEYTRTWVKAAMDTVKGKPQGIIPASIRFPDESVNGDEPTWYKANMYWDYYDWEANAGSMMLDQMLFTYKMTGDPGLLVPLSKTLDLIQTYDSVTDNSRQYPPGSAQWAVALLKQERNFWSVVSQ